MLRNDASETRFPNTASVWIQKLSPPQHVHSPSSGPLHICLASTQAKWHGGEKQAALLAEGLTRIGHRCSILARAEGEFSRRMQAAGYEVHTFSGSGRSVSACMHIRRALKTLRPDVLHANDAHALTATGVAGVGLDIPLRVAARRVDFPIRSRFRYRYLAHGLICVSRAVASVCRASGLPADHLHVVHDGVEPTFAESGSRETGRASLELSAEQQLLLTVAKLTDHKGHTYLLQAIPQIVEQHPNVVLALAGDGELRSELETEVRQLGIERYVRFLGYRNDVADLLAAADLIVQPSHMEGLCSSLIDAMLAARPIVACRAGGIPDLLQTEAPDEPVGWLTESRNPDALATAICTSLSDVSESQRRADAARKRALKKFTAEQMVKDTLSAYAVIARHRYGNQAAERLPSLASDAGVSESATSATCSVTRAA